MFVISEIGVMLCSLAMFVAVTATQGVVIHAPKYYESKGPFSYTLHDWLGDMPMFLMNASPVVLGTVAAIFALHWWLNRGEAQTRNRAVIHATRAALVFLLLTLASIFIGEIVVYKEATKKIARLNKYGPPK